VQGGYGAHFESPGTNFIEHYAYRGTSFIASMSQFKVQRSYRQQWRGRDIGITNLSWQQEQQEQISKNMTTQTTFIVRVGYSFSLFSVSVKRSSV
jgi:hypothetical protein